MATKSQHSTGLPLQEITVLKNTTARAMELVILSLLICLLVYRAVSFKDQDHLLPWLLALLLESWFTFNWILSMSIKWNQCTTTTYPERLRNRINESEFPAVDIFVTTADAILEPSIITMNTVLSLLAVNYPAEKLALYLSDDGCSPLTFYSLVETTKFATVWVPFCKKYDVQVRAPFRYFTPKSMPLEDDPLEFQQEWKRMKNEYGNLCKKIELAAKSPFPCDRNSDFAIFNNVHRSNHPTIIKVISENKEGTPDDIPHVIYLSREKSPKHHHHYKAGAMNVLTRVSGIMTNAPLMLNVDCDMYVNNPQVFLHAMCMVFDSKNKEGCAFYQFPQAFYDGLEDDPFGSQVADLYYYINGITAQQGIFYGGSNCIHRRYVIYGSSPSDTVKTEKRNNEDLHKIFGKSMKFRESAAEILSGSSGKIENGRSPSKFIEAAIQVASCSYEYGTAWGKQVGLLYGSATEDFLTGIAIHGRGWKSTMTSPKDRLAFLGCSPSTYPNALTQQKRWITGLLEILFTHQNPLIVLIKGKIWFRQALAYLWFCMWGIRSIPELCYASLPAYHIINNSHFLPSINEPSFAIPLGIFVAYNLYSLWELRRIGISYRMWWNLQKMARINTMTAWVFATLSVSLKLVGLSETVFELTPKEQRSDDSDDDGITDTNAGRFTFDKSPMVIPGVTILLVNLTALVHSISRLLNLRSQENWSVAFGLGEMVCSLWVTLCFWEYLKGLFGRGKYGIPSSTIWKSVALALLFVQFCRRSF